METSASAAERWVAAFPGDGRLPGDFLPVLDRLIGDGELEAAAYGLAVARRRFPDDRGLATREARIAEKRGDWPAAIACWQAIQQRNPDNRAILQGLAMALIGGGRLAEAEALLAAPCARVRAGEWHVSDAPVRRMMVEHARLALARGDVAAAAARWNDLLALLPQDKAVRAGVRETRHQAAWAQADADAAPAAAPDGQEADLLARFEGLGGTCEFGLVQRQFGLETLGLFRWVSISHFDLNLALESELDGIGAPEFTRLDVSDAREFLTRDTRYGMLMHTLVRDVGQDREAILQQQMRRLVFLRRKMLEDLREGRKIFVYRYYRAPRRQALPKFIRALLGYNPSNRVLLVHRLEHGAAASGVRLAAPGVAACGIGDGRIAGSGSGWDIDFAGWTAACRSALEVLR